MFCYAYICEPEAILNPALQIMKRPREQAEFQPELEEEKNRLNDRAKAGEISGEEVRNERETLQSSLGQEEDAQVIPLTDTAPVESVTYTDESGREESCRSASAGTRKNLKKSAAEERYGGRKNRRQK